MNTFRWVFVKVFRRSFTFVNMRFIVEVIFFSIKFYKNIYFYGKFNTEFTCYFLFYPLICFLG